MDKSTEQLLNKVYASGLNIYALQNKFKKEMSYELPDHILAVVCEEYLKTKPKIEHPWPWFVRVLRQKRDDAYVTTQQKKEKEYKNKTNTMLLKNIFGGVT